VRIVSWCNGRNPRKVSKQPLKPILIPEREGIEMPNDHREVEFLAFGRGFQDEWVLSPTYYISTTDMWMCY
jgi:hypothetical protein